MYSYWPSNYVPFESMQGLTLASIEGMEVGSEKISFVSTCGRVFVMWYEPDCCATCTVEDVCGDPADLLGVPLAVCEERCMENCEGDKPGEYADSWTWTFYELRTIKGSVTLRWLGESNGYYSESVSFREDERQSGPNQQENQCDT